MTLTLADLLPPDILHDLRGQDGGWMPGPVLALTGGRTNGVWQVGNRVLKHHRPEAATPLFPNDPMAEARALRRLAPEGLAPTLRAVSGQRRAGQSAPPWMLIDHVPGQTWGRQSDQDPAPVARTLGQLHRLGGVEGFRPLPNGSAALRQDARRVAGSLPMPPMPDVPDLPPGPACPVHADAVAGNILCAGDRMILIDWQCPGLGDPAEDLATFLSPAMQWLYTGRSLTAQQRRRFLHSYPQQETVARFLALEPLYAWRIAAHCAHRAAGGDADYARALQQMA